MNAPTRSSKSSAATWIAAALVVLPFLQALSFDFDRSGAVVLLLPAWLRMAAERTRLAASARSGTR